MTACQASVAPPDVSNYRLMPHGLCRVCVCVAIGVAAVALTACTARTSPPAAGPLRVSAAVSLTDALGEVAKRWEAAGNPHVELNFAASNVLARQILEG